MMLKINDAKNKVNELPNSINKTKLLELKNKYYLDKLFAKGFFSDEYRKFKEKTGKILIATYLGGNSMSLKNYSFKIVDKNTKMTIYDKEFEDDCVFEELIVKLYDNPNNYYPCCFERLLTETFDLKI